MKEKVMNILIVDDDLKLADLLKIHLLSIGGIYCRTVDSAVNALDYLERDEFDVVISDYRMPEMDGLQLMKIIKNKYPHIIKVLFSGFGDLSALQEEIRDVEVGYFISKPWQHTQLRILVDALLADFIRINKIKSLEDDVVEYRAKVTELEGRLSKNLQGLVLILRETLQEASPRVASHCRRTAILVTTLARRMKLTKMEILELEWAALFHDYSLAMEDEVIQEGSELFLSEEQKKKFKNHPGKIHEMFSKIDHFQKVAEIIRLHHENVDGSGFYGLKDDEIPLSAKMLRICDFFDEEQTYNRNAHKNVLEFMVIYEGKWFDKTCLTEFCEMVKSLKK